MINKKSKHPSPNDLIKRDIGLIRPRFRKSIEKLTLLNNLELQNHRDIDTIHQNKKYKFTLFFKVKT